MVMGKKKSSSKKASAGCRRHRQPADGVGVCPCCLRERLSRLSPAASLPSVIAVPDSASCSDYSEAASSSSSLSTEGSTGASSGSASPGFHREFMRGSARPSLLMRRERVVAVDGDEVAGIMIRRRRKERTGFWTKLLRAATGGGSSGKKKKQVDGCSMAAHSKTMEAAETTRWIIF